MAFGWLLTFRGIPQMYYEYRLMTGVTSPHDGYVRCDFGSGWAGDSKQIHQGWQNRKRRTCIRKYIRTLANFRKRSSAIASGKLMQFLQVFVDGGVCTLLIDAKQTVMVIMNTTTAAKQVDSSCSRRKDAGFTSEKMRYDQSTINLNDKYGHLVDCAGSELNKK